jgi:hypothetical protein
MTRRESILTGLTLIALLLATGWSCSELASQRDAAQFAQFSTANCRALAATIKSSAASTSSSLILHPSSFSASLSSAADQAQIAPSSIAQIDPQPIRPVADSSFEQHPVRISFHDLTLRQLVSFLHALPYPAEELHLSATSDTTNTWSADLTVTYIAPAREASPASISQ